MGECPGCHLFGHLCVACGFCWSCHPELVKRSMELEALVTGNDPFTGKKVEKDGG